MTGGITRVGDASVRTALHDAANALLTRATTVQHARSIWAVDVAKRSGHAEFRQGGIGTQRFEHTVLHRIWADGTEFVWGKDPAAAAA